MVLFNYSTKELTAKVVYYGPGLCGKTTNLQWVHEKLPIKNKGKMLSLATETDRTLFFDFLPIELGTIRGMKTRIQLYTVPGQVFYNATRRMVLKGADCVVFVCDSQEAMLDANVESLENLRQNLEANELNPDDIPMVLQYNKRDLPNALPIEILNERLNPRGVPFFEAVAIKGLGVEETLKGVTQVVFRTLAGKYGGVDTGATPAVAAASSASGPPSPVVPAVAAPQVRAAVPAVAAPPPKVAETPQSRPAPPLRPAPIPAPRPAPQPPPPPPSVEAADDLLDAIELQPHDPDYPIELPEEVPLPVPPHDAIDELVALDVEELELPMSPPRPQPPAKTPAAAKTTLVSGPRETDELRRKISRPRVPDLTMDEIGDEEEEEFEVSFHATPPPRPPVLAPAPSPPPPPPVLAPAPPPQVRTVAPPPQARTVAPQPPAPPRPAPPQAPPAASSAAPSANPAAPRVGATTIPPGAAAPPLSVTLPEPGRVADLMIPVEVKVGEGEAQVSVHIRLSLSLKLER